MLPRGRELRIYATINAVLPIAATLLLPLLPVSVRMTAAIFAAAGFVLADVFRALEVPRVRLVYAVTAALNVGAILWLGALSVVTAIPALLVLAFG